MAYSEEYNKAIQLEKEGMWKEAALAYEQMLLVNETLNAVGVTLVQNNTRTQLKYLTS